MNPFTHLHDWSRSASWSRPRLDRLSTLSRSRLATIVDRAPAPVTATASHSPTPRVSVVIPCFNYGRFLASAVASAVDQIGADVEVIIVDDASTDDTAVVARALCAADGRVHLLTHVTNLGHDHTFNDGVAVATGEFIVRLDADDQLTPGSLSRALDLFLAHPSVGLVYGYPHHFETEHPPEPRVGDISWTVWSGQDWIGERCRLGVNCITTSEAVVRASVIEKVGPFNTRLRFAQDMELWLRVAAVSDVGRINDADQALHRDHPDSLSVTAAAGAMVDLEERRDAFAEFLDAMGDELDRAEELRRTAARSLAREALAQATYLYDRGRFDRDVVTSLVSYAKDTYPGYQQLAQWRALRRRERFGPALVRLDPFAVGRVAVNRARCELDYLRWTRTGL